jgi:hypothetical protein
VASVSYSRSLGPRPRCLVSSRMTRRHGSTGVGRLPAVSRPTGSPTFRSASFHVRTPRACPSVSSEANEMNQGLPWKAQVWQQLAGQHSRKPAPF